MYRFDNKMREIYLRWYGHMLRRPTDQIIGRCEMITISGKIRGRERQKDVNRNK